MFLDLEVWISIFGSYFMVLTKVSEGLFLGTVFLSCWQAVGELSASQRHNWQTDRERESEREIKKEPLCSGFAPHACDLNGGSIPW